MLHVAPEPCFKSLFAKAAGVGYLTADLNGREVMEQMDITCIRHRDASFDVIYCSHVLEHVSDDRRAIRELFRVLRSGGWAILNVPVIALHTFEDPSIIDPVERERFFGQSDHVRAYGLDYCQRLEEAGFSVSVFRPGDLLDGSDMIKYGLAAGGAGEVFYCQKSV